MKSPAEIIYNLLEDLGHINSSDTWPAYISFMPDTPHEAVCVYDTAGSPDGRLMTTGVRIEHLGVQVRLRGRDYVTTWQKADAIAKDLDNQLNVSVAMESDQTYVVNNVSRQGTIIAAGIDETENKRRHYFTVNLVVTVQDPDEATAIS